MKKFLITAFKPKRLPNNNLTVKTPNLLKNIPSEIDNLTIKRQDETSNTFPKEIWSLILFLLQPDDFYRLGIISKWFYALTRSEDLIKNTNLDLWSYHFYNTYELVKSVKGLEDLKNLVITGRNNIFYAYYEVNAANVPYFFPIIETAITYKNFDIYDYMLSRVERSQKKYCTQAEEFSLRLDRGVFSAILLFPTYFGLHIRDVQSTFFENKKDNDYYIREVLDRAKWEWRNNEVHRDHLCTMLVQAGPKWIFRTIKFLQNTDLSCNKGIECTIETNFLTIARQLEDEACVSELLNSSFADYLLKLEFQQKIKASFERSLVANASTSNDSECQKKVLPESPKVENLQVIQDKLNQLETLIESKDIVIQKMSEKLDNAMNLISNLQKELEELKKEKLNSFPNSQNKFAWSSSHTKVSNLKESKQECEDCALNNGPEI